MIISLFIFNGIITKSVSKPLACNTLKMDNQNIIVIGDIHGDKEAFVEILQKE